MKRLLRSIVFVTVMASVMAACRQFQNSSRRPSGRLIEDDGITVVELSGSWQEMGAQYGRLVKPYLEDVLEFLDSKLAANDEISAEAAQQKERASDIADKLYANYPDHLKDFCEAAADAAGISLERFKLCNASEYIEGCFHCSAMAVWGEYSSGGLVFGRNYDAVSYADIDKDVLVTVFHPEDGMAAATIGYAGEIYCVNGINEKGIFIELNNGMPSAGWDIHWDMCPSTTELFNLLFKAQTIEDADDFFGSVRSAGSFLIGVADSKEARLYEWCHDGVKRSDTVTPDGLMVATNHYVHPDWGYGTPSEAGSWNSLTRRANLLERAEEYKGRADVETVKTVMSTPMEAGGPNHDPTRYLIVVTPEDMTMHMKISCRSTWSTLDLSRYLKEN